MASRNREGMPNENWNDRYVWSFTLLAELIIKPDFGKYKYTLKNSL